VASGSASWIVLVEMVVIPVLKAKPTHAVANF
jgi:hypothetical protein